MKKIICGEENVKEFNRLLKATVPEFHDLVKVLYAEGMIKGLRGATIEFNDGLTKVCNPPPQSEEKKCCENCRHWLRDKVGFGDGIGVCLLNSRPRVLKWPKQPECEKFIKAL